MKKYSIDLEETNGKESPMPLKSNRLLENANLVSQVPSNHRATLVEKKDFYDLK